MRWISLSLLFFACKPDAADGPCADLCANLVTHCGYEAFPDYDSCLQGCTYDEEQGKDVDAELACVEAADCDTFAILECEHAE